MENIAKMHKNTLEKWEGKGKDTVALPLSVCMTSVPSSEIKNSEYTATHYFIMSYFKNKIYFVH